MMAAAVVVAVGHDVGSHELQPPVEVVVVARTVVAEVGVEDILHPRQPPSKSEGFRFLTCKVGTRFTVFDPFLSPIQRTLLDRLGLSEADSCTLGKDNLEQCNVYEY